jgi:hypothetical protein
MEDSVKKQIYDILVSHCGASERWRNNFYAMFPCDEYRFQGDLGFGGKIRYREGRLWVDYYPEDETDAKETICSTANYALKQIEPLLPH